MLLLRSFIDVERIFRERTVNYTQLPEGILRIDCFYEGIEIALSQPEQKDPVISLLKQWFGTWLDEKRLAILLDIDDAILSIELIEDETKKYERQSIRPLWHEVACLISNEQEKSTKKPEILPPEFSSSLNMAVFHSFKGGVGRTTHLVAYLLALLKRAKELKQEVNILVIDSDLEAPGLTYWQRHENLELSVSLIDFLEAYHYPPSSREAVIAFYAKELKRTQHSLGFYLLPAFLDERQLLDIGVLPEHLVRSPDNIWRYSQAFEELAKALGTSFVLIDLRAGLSELASPLLFDPRLERYLVTTLSEQSVSGTCLVLKSLASMMPDWDLVKKGPYFDPTVVLSMIPPELVKSPIYDENVQRLLDSYSEVATDDISFSSRVSIKESHFAQELLLLSGWDDARQKLAGTSMMKLAEQWAEERLEIPISSSTDNTGHGKSDLFTEEVTRLLEVCRNYEYAETTSISDDLLFTDSLKNLAKNHVDKLPKIVSIGAKGAGKTFNYLQLVKSGKWNDFLKKADISTAEHHDTFIFPFLPSKNLSENTQDPIQLTRTAFLQAVGSNTLFSTSQLVDEIKEKLRQKLNDIEWTHFWIDNLNKIVNYPRDSISDNPTEKLINLDAFLKQKHLQVIFLFDGLEEQFPEVAKEPVQQCALKALLDLPNRLEEIRQSSIGVIIFLRRDFVRYVVQQNVGQFEKRYELYDLSWDFKSFLQLVYWICAHAKVIGATPDKVYQLSVKELRQELEKLWGKKLGADDSKEAHTIRWIYAALTDFLGKLQARDSVRFLFFAAEYIINNKSTSEKRKSTRLLSPVAIRDSLKKCSERKVEEAKQEYPEVFKEWVTKLDNVDSKKRKIPFNPHDFGMEQPTIEILGYLGVIYEDKDAKKEKARFYIPEIFRAGLGFEYASKGRSRIIALKRRILEDAGV